MANVNNFKINFAQQGAGYSYNEMSGVGSTIADFGWDGIVPVVIESFEVTSNESRGTKSLQLDARVVDLPADRVDRIGRPCNGQSVRGWLEIDGVDRNGKSFFWKLANLLIHTGTLTPEQVQSGIETGLDMTAQQIGEEVCGKKVHFKISHRPDRNGTGCLTGLQTTVSEKVYQQLSATPHVAGPQYNQAYYPETSSKVSAARSQAGAGAGAGVAGAGAGAGMHVVASGGVPTPAPGWGEGGGPVVTPSNGVGTVPGHQVNFQGS
jgi:hypothetical protein